jgi:hypothetical protein
MLSNVRKCVKQKPISRQNNKLTQQHNWKKSSSSPRAVSVLSNVCKYVKPKPISRQNQKTDTTAQLEK